ncbi:polysaccharide lyase family protein [Hymenobacter sp. NBH84]|uniref:polysaccharide lyase family protein n=1 Tax=Hymenobacter sp. NBH84 TaxID=2596915 RepID=UPI0021561E7E|nr:polysaccharide lyase family protein [Hymenobacter sp. NBH84]
MTKTLFWLLLLLSVAAPSHAQQPERTLWQVGKADQSGAEFALAPAGFRKFVGQDFGYEDKCFFIGASKEKQDFPYVLPGPVDTWGGTWSTAGWRTNQVNLLFTLKKLPATGSYKLVIRLADYAKTFLPLLQISINGQEERIQLSAAGYDVRQQRRPTMTESPADTASISGNLVKATPKIIEIPLDKGVLQAGGNQVTITVTEGSWILFDQVSLLGPSGVTVQRPQQLFCARCNACSVRAGCRWAASAAAAGECAARGGHAYPKRTAGRPNHFQRASRKGRVRV